MEHDSVATGRQKRAVGTRSGVSCWLRCCASPRICELIPNVRIISVPALKASGVHKAISPSSEVLSISSDAIKMAPEYELWTYYRSSCSARVRIAAHWKGIELKYKYIHLLKNEQQASDYVDKYNPSKTVPTLVVREDGKEYLIRQSVSILEYLEEVHPELPRLLPSTADPVARAKVRDLVNIVACDLQPVTNLRILNRIRPLGVAAENWQQEFMGAGLEAYEKVASLTSGKFSVGEEVTMADVVLVPAVDGALRFKVDMAQYPTIMRIYEEAQKLEAFNRGSWKTQPDTPEELR